MNETYTQPALEVKDPTTFIELIAALDHAFAPNLVTAVLNAVKKAGLRIREYDAILAKGLLGRGTQALYAKLSDSDRGQIRERYLRLVEKVAPELRAKFLKVYAYY